MSSTGFIKRHPVLVFYALAIIYSWIWFSILFVIAPEGFPSGTAVVGGPALFALFAAIGPTLAGIVMTSIIDGRQGLRALRSRLGRWRVSFGWYVVALFTTPILLIGILSILSLAFSPVFLPAVLTARDIAALVGFGLALFAVAGLFEELGWTGFAIPKLQSHFSPLATGLIIGVGWGIWHFLGDYWGNSGSYGALYVPNFVAFVAVVVAYRTLIVWVYNNSKGSLLLAVLMHGSFSGSQFILIPPLPVTDWVLVRAVLAAVLWLVVAVVVATRGKRLVREPRTQDK